MLKCACPFITLTSKLMDSSSDKASVKSVLDAFKGRAGSKSSAPKDPLPERKAYIGRFKTKLNKASDTVREKWGSICNLAGRNAARMS